MLRKFCDLKCTTVVHSDVITMHSTILKPDHFSNTHAIFRHFTKIWIISGPDFTKRATSTSVQSEHAQPENQMLRTRTSNARINCTQNDANFNDMKSSSVMNWSFPDIANEDKSESETFNLLRSSLVCVFSQNTLICRHSLRQTSLSSLSVIQVKDLDEKKYAKLSSGTRKLRVKISSVIVLKVSCNHISTISYTIAVETKITSTTYLGASTLLTKKKKKWCKSWPTMCLDKMGTFV